MWSRIENCRVAASEELILESGGNMLVPIENARVKVNENYELDPNGNLVTDFLNARVEVGDDRVWDFGGIGGGKPTYKAPTLGLAVTPTAAELGSTVNLVVTPTWTKNDAGSPNNYRILVAGAEVYTAPAPVTNTRSNVTIDASKSIMATVSYDAGAIKNDSDGNPYPTGAITAGTITQTVLISAYRKAFWTTSPAQMTVPTTSAEIRAWASSTGAAQSSFKITIPINTIDIIFAYPASLGNNITIYARSFGGIDYASAFVRSTVNVEGANGSTAVPYNVWYCHNDEGLTVADEYTITII